VQCHRYWNSSKTRAKLRAAPAAITALEHIARGGGAGPRSKILQGGGADILVDFLVCGDRELESRALLALAAVSEGRKAEFKNHLSGVKVVTDTLERFKLGSQDMKLRNAAVTLLKLV